jgi:two-component system, OmpR family, response regulator
MSLEHTDILDIYGVTPAGTAELRSGSTTLSVEALRMMVMFDGKSSVGEIARRANGPTSAQIQQLLPELLQKKYVEIVKPGALENLDFGSFFIPASSAAPAGGGDSPKVREEAEKAASSLNANGYYVSIAQQASGKKPPASGSKYSILVIEDNEPLKKALTMLLRVDGFETRTAANRDEIVAALRTMPLPDVILLDVNLPDTNGFDILVRIRQHPMLKDIPVIMLTAQTSRNDVLRGLAGGANGYMTKPFEHDVLARSLKAVLGL